MERSGRKDAYALVGMGNIWLEQLHTIKHSDETQKNKYNKLKSACPSPVTPDLRLQAARSTCT